MKRFRYSILLMTVISVLSCDNDEVNVPLNTDTDLSFSGTFKTINAENVSGTVTLHISKGYYNCTTNLSFGHGAGRLEINESTINFIDTLFVPIPSLYGPSYVLSGKHQYKFDGDHLEIRRAKNVGDVEYKLQLMK